MSTVEDAILTTMAELAAKGVRELHGYRIAQEIKERHGTRFLLAHGTLYRALHAVEKVGFLVSRWEDPALAAEERRPPRKLYSCAFPLSPCESGVHRALSRLPQSPKWPTREEVCGCRRQHPQEGDDNGNGR